jgi:aminoglycoside 3-N-acetyltransferase
MIDSVIEKLAEDWTSSGVCSGDVLLVHSNIKRTFKCGIKMGVRLSGDDILSSFLKALGPDGTLLLPLYNFDFASGTSFDIRSSPSHMGALTEAGRLYEGAVRTGHPIYSFAVIGKHADKFKNIDNFSGYGDDSPFAMLRKLNGKIASLDLPDQNSMTFYHHVEEMNEVDYRYHKTFTGNYTDINGKKSQKKYGLFVRDIERNVLTHVDPAGELMWDAGLYSGDRPGEGCGLRVIGSNDMFEFVANIIKTDKALNNLYKIGNSDHE